MTQDINCRAQIPDPEPRYFVQPGSQIQGSKKYWIRIRNTASNIDQRIQNRINYLVSGILRLLLLITYISLQRKVKKFPRNYNTFNIQWIWTMQERYPRSD
jgi:hypothetical protein